MERDPNPPEYELADEPPAQHVRPAGQPLGYATPVRPQQVIPMPAAPSRPVVPPGGVIYRVDNARAGFGEMLRQVRSPMVLVPWAAKLLRIRMPGAVSGINVESLRPFEVPYGELPTDVQRDLYPKLAEFASLGFDARKPVAHVVIDMFHNSRAYIASIPRNDGRAIARVVVWSHGLANPPKAQIYGMIVSERTGGSFLMSNAARAGLDCPSGITPLFRPQATPSQLWDDHSSALDAGPSLRLAASRDEMLALLDRYHIKIRDFHLKRGLFVPMTARELEASQSISSSYAAAVDTASVYPDIYAEMERLQTSQSGWQGGILILGVSLLMFIAAGTGDGAGSTRGRSWEALFILVPILFFHELGHYLAMRVFGYRNLRMFFIPFFGAAVSGHSYGAPGWKKVIVSLMGPVPGIVVGLVLGAVGAFLHHALLLKIAVMALILNGFNLVPILPFDGGRVAQSLFFSRHYLLDVAFRAVAGLALLAAALGTHSKIFIYLGIVMLIGIVMAFRLGKLAQSLRETGIVPPRGNSEKIAPPVADAIVTRLMSDLPKSAPRNNKTIAQHALSVYELVSSRPPGWGATIGFTAMHAFAFIAALIGAVGFTIAQRNNTTRNPFARFDAEPKYTLSPSDIIVAQDAALSHSPATQTSRRITLIAIFPTQPAAIGAMSRIQTAVGPEEGLERVGQLLLVSLPAEPDSLRSDWLERLEKLTPNVLVDDGAVFNAGLSVQCKFASAQEAERTGQRLKAYVGLPRTFYPVAPWSPQRNADPATREVQDRARQTYIALTGLQREIYKDPRWIAGSKDLASARRKGDTAKFNMLKAGQADVERTIHLDLIDQLLRRQTNLDAEVASAYRDTVVNGSMLNDMADSDEEGESATRPSTLPASFGPIARRMGQLPLMEDHPTPTDDRYSSLPTWCQIKGDTIRFFHIQFVDTFSGMPALLRWLNKEGARELKYELRSFEVEGEE